MGETGSSVITLCCCVAVHDINLKVDFNKNILITVVLNCLLVSHILPPMHLFHFLLIVGHFERH